VNLSDAPDSQSSKNPATPWPAKRAENVSVAAVELTTSFPLDVVAVCHARP
jgi:hypothetical protein